MGKKVLISLGGNALSASPEKAEHIAQQTAKNVVDLLELDYKIIICHGNGPQVGMIDLAFLTAHNHNSKVPFMPFYYSDAMSQGYIGCDLQTAIGNEIKARQLNHHVVSLITQVVVDKNDPAFSDPVKYIGAFYNQADAQALIDEYNWTFKEVPKQGFRRVVPSPKPLHIEELEAVKHLLAHGDHIVIAGGGGGIPVIKEGNTLKKVAAVIDKDFTSAKLALLVEVDAYVCFTNVDNIFINFDKPNQEALTTVTVSALEKHIAEGQFSQGSMLPKVLAALQFVKETKKPAWIGNLNSAKAVIHEQAGTKIIFG